MSDDKTNLLPTDVMREMLASQLEGLAADIRSGGIHVASMSDTVLNDAESKFGAPLECEMVIRYRKYQTEQEKDPLALNLRIGKRLLGPCTGFSVEPVGSSERVQLSVRCLSTYEDVEYLARTASQRSKRLRMIPGGDTGGRPGG